MMTDRWKQIIRKLRPQRGRAIGKGAPFFAPMSQMAVRTWVLSALMIVSPMVGESAAASPETFLQDSVVNVANTDSPDTGNLTGPSKTASQSQASLERSSPSLSLAPSVIVFRAEPGMSFTRSLTLSNQTAHEFSSEMVAKDVVVRDGKRVFVSAGEAPRSIAASAVFSSKYVTVKPWQEATVEATATLPRQTDLRAIVAIFQGINKIHGSENVMMTASLGSLITFLLPGGKRVEGSPIQVRSQTATRNLSITEVLFNTGTEIVIPKGMAALLDESGKRLGTTVFEPKRLLPGERLEFTADFPAQLRPGRYRVFASFEYEDRTIIHEADFALL